MKLNFVPNLFAFAAHAESQNALRSRCLLLLRLVRWPRRRRLLPLLHVLYLRIMTLDQLLCLPLVALFHLLFLHIICSLLIELLVIPFLFLLQLLLLLGLLRSQLFLLLFVFLIEFRIAGVRRIELFVRLNFARVSRIWMRLTVVIA